MTIVQISMITDYLCLFLGLYFTSVFLVPFIFICGVNFIYFFPLAIKGEILGQLNLVINVMDILSILASHIVVINMVIIGVYAKNTGPYRTGM